MSGGGPPPPLFAAQRSVQTLRFPRARIIRFRRASARGTVQHSKSRSFVALIAQARLAPPQDDKQMEGKSTVAAPWRCRLGGCPAGVSPAPVVPAKCRRYTRRRGHTSTSSLREKCSSGGTSGGVMPAARAIVLTSISASASCRGQGTWWISARKVLRPVVV